MELPVASLARIREARDVASELRRESDLGALLGRYHQCDRALRVLEEYLGDAVEDYDRLQHQIDLERGK